MFELSLQYSLLSDHNVVNAALEALQQLLKTEFASVLKTPLTMQAIRTPSSSSQTKNSTYLLYRYL